MIPGFGRSETMSTSYGPGIIPPILASSAIMGMPGQSTKCGDQGDIMGYFLYIYICICICKYYIKIYEAWNLCFCFPVISDFYGVKGFVCLNQSRKSWVFVWFIQPVLKYSNHQKR